MDVTLYSLAHRLIGTTEIPGETDNPFIRWCHASTTIGEQPDEVPWCSSFVNRLADLLNLPRSKSAAARSWLTVGKPVDLLEAEPGFDVVVFRRGKEPQLGPEVTSGAPGHVALFAGWDGTGVRALGGNQGNQVSIDTYPVDRVLGVRRLHG